LSIEHLVIALELVFVLLGVFFMLVAAVGVLRLPDFYARVHAPTKAATLGLFFLLLAVLVALPEGVVATKALLALLFIGATAPVGAHILARAAYRNGVPAAPDTELDEYAPIVQRRKRRLAEPEHAADVDADQL
jgi:multicomponent Na+:H+ antiporter subunit G